MRAYRTSATLMSERMDANYYLPVYVENAGKLRNRKTSKLKDLYLKTGIGHTASVEPHYDRSGNGIPFIAGGAIKDGQLLIDSAERIKPESHYGLMKKSRLKPGYLLAVRKGAVGNSCAVPSHSNELNCSSEIIYFKPKQTTDTHFLSVFCNSSHGTLSFLRVLRGSIIPAISLLDIPLMDVYWPDPLVRKYIGDKIRQAERLREVGAKALDSATSILERCLYWRSELQKTHRSRRLKLAEISDRLDGNYNSPTRLFLMDHLDGHRIKRAQMSKLAGVSAMIGWKGLTTEHYTETGPWLLRGLEIVNGVIDFDALVSVERQKYDEQPQIHLQKGDVALSKDGTIGKAAVIPELPQEMAVGSTVARLRLREQSGINPYYLEHVLNHEVLQIQIRSYATGMAQPHITQEWIDRLEIPRCKQEDEIANLVKRHHSAIALAKDLTLVARFLVEALIEVRVSESELVAVQKACERGDRRGERSLLSRMTRKGMDVSGAPAMFLDLDALDEPVEHAADILMPAEAK
jgi:type I restriction enzyme, S subunit